MTCESGAPTVRTVDGILQSGREAEDVPQGDVLTARSRGTVTAYILGGFGNQMFIACAAAAFARATGRTLRFDLSYYRRPIPKQPISGFLNPGVTKSMEKHTFSSRDTVICRDESRFAPLKDVAQDDAVLGGYFQSHHYLTEGWQDALGLPEVTETRVGTVGMHVRRGDYVKLGHALPVHFFKRALTYLESRAGALKLLIVTEDEAFCAKHFAAWEPEIVNTVPDDAAWIMASCEHRILSASSFSWWADHFAVTCFSSTGIVIAPTY